MGPEKRVPAVELMAVLVASIILPFVSFAQATSETSFYRQVWLKRTRLDLLSSSEKCLFERKRFSSSETQHCATRVVLQGCSFLFFFLSRNSTLQVGHQKQNQWLNCAPHRTNSRSGEGFLVSIFFFFYHLFQCSWCTFAQTWTRFRSVPL